MYDSVFMIEDLFGDEEGFGGVDLAGFQLQEIQAIGKLFRIQADGLLLSREGQVGGEKRLSHGIDYSGKDFLTDQGRWHGDGQQIGTQWIGIYGEVQRQCGKTGSGCCSVLITPGINAVISILLNGDLLPADAPVQHHVLFDDDGA